MISKEIIWLLIGVVITVIVVLINSIAKNNKIKVSGQETFIPSKFISGMLGMTDTVGWAKDIYSLFNIRKIIVYLIIGGLIFGYAYWQGLQTRPIKIDLGYGKEANIKLDGHYLHIYKDGSVWVEDSNGKKIKQISVKDVPGLSEKLRPYGFRLKPIIVGGGSIGSSMTAGIEGGVGVSFFQFWKIQTETFITSHPAVYIGGSYCVTDNSGAGVAIGKSLSDMQDTRVIGYYRFNF